MAAYLAKTTLRIPHCFPETPYAPIRKVSEPIIVWRFEAMWVCEISKCARSRDFDIPRNGFFVQVSYLAYLWAHPIETTYAPTP